ncbi:MAG: hypothetical protein MJ141_06715, partial [Clostridia bacterium]|nr:hypothetical protein [Clostridia bacterium]
SSTTPADNGPGTPENEGLSFVVTDDGKKALLTDLVSKYKAEAVGENIWDKYGKWPMYSKFCDNLGPLPHHIHHREEHAKNVGLSGKPEMYFFPAQYNNYPGEYAFTFFGVTPGTPKEKMLEILKNFTKGDNDITAFAQAYKLRVHTGWAVPAGVLHAPGSLCTYEPQFASDVYAMYQSVLLHDHTVSEDLLWANTPKDKIGDFEYLLDVIDWEANVDPNFYTNRFMEPTRCAGSEEEGWFEEWICYKSDVAGAKRLTVLPGGEATIRDAGAYGTICLEGHGKFGVHDIEAPTLIRFGQLTRDEYFVTAPAAREGVKIKNLSTTQPLVLLKHMADTSEAAYLRK